MIIWIASYPKSGNTYVRSFLSAYYFSKDGEFNFDLLQNIKQFPNVEFFEKPLDNVHAASENWITAQRKIKEEKKARFLKTHNCLGKFMGKPFTTTEFTLGGIYVVRDPRNVITSVKNHYSYNDNEALKFVTNSNTEIKEKNSNDFRTWSLLSSWSNHYRSGNRSQSPGPRTGSLAGLGGDCSPAASRGRSPSAVAATQEVAMVCTPSQNARCRPRRKKIPLHPCSRLWRLFSAAPRRQPPGGMEAHASGTDP